MILPSVQSFGRHRPPLQPEKSRFKLPHDAQAEKAKAAQKFKLRRKAVSATGSANLESIDAYRCGQKPSAPSSTGGRSFWACMKLHGQQAHPSRKQYQNIPIGCALSKQ